MEYFVFIMFSIATILMVKFHLQIASNRSDVELNVAERLAARSHRLIEKGVNIDMMQYSYEKHEQYTEWVYEMHAYMDEYEEELNEALNADKKILLFKSAYRGH